MRCRKDTFINLRMGCKTATLYEFLPKSLNKIDSKRGLGSKIEAITYQLRLITNVGSFWIHSSPHQWLELKVSWIQNEFMMSSFLPNYKRKISALTTQAEILTNFVHILGKRWLHKFILKLTDLYTWTIVDFLLTSLPLPRTSCPRTHWMTSYPNSFRKLLYEPWCLEVD